MKIMLQKMNRAERLRLIRFVASFAWADGVVKDQEREFLRGLMKRLPLEPDEIALAEGWLDRPPHAAEVDPAQIPHKHRHLFLTMAKGVISADGEIDPEEAERLELLKELLLGHKGH